MSAVDPQKVASILADVAAQEIVPRFRNLKHGDVRKKAGDETVTVADEAAERALTSRLTALLPGSVAVGEEGAAENPAVMDLLAGDAPVWVVDPIDGTRNFAAGKPEFAVMAALVTRNATLASWIYRPMSGASYVAERGAGAWLNGARMTPPPAPGADNELVGTIRFMFFPEQAREALRAKARSAASSATVTVSSPCFLRMSPEARLRKRGMISRAATSARMLATFCGSTADNAWPQP